VSAHLLTQQLGEEVEHVSFDEKVLYVADSAAAQSFSIHMHDHDDMSSDAVSCSFVEDT
jgi:sugar lactone lactonase YvrE